MSRHKKINPNIQTVLLWGGISLVLLSMPVIYGPPILGQQKTVAFMQTFEFLLVTIFWIGIISIVCSEIYFLKVLYRCWSILQDSTARTTPGRAAGFLFIPLFNFYWVFVSIKGLANDANDFLKLKNANGHKISIWLSIATCIAMILPSVNLLISPILQNILIYQWASFFNYSVTNLMGDHK